MTRFDMTELRRLASLPQTVQNTKAISEMLNQPYGSSILPDNFFIEAKTATADLLPLQRQLVSFVTPIAERFNVVGWTGKYKFNKHFFEARLQDDLTRFLEQRYPDNVALQDTSKSMAEEYRKSGRWAKENQMITQGFDSKESSQPGSSYPKSPKGGSDSFRVVENSTRDFNKISNRSEYMLLKQEPHSSGNLESYHQPSLLFFGMAFLVAGSALVYSCIFAFIVKFQAFLQYWNNRLK